MWQIQSSLLGCEFFATVQSRLSAGRFFLKSESEIRFPKACCDRRLSFNLPILSG